MPMKVAWDADVAGEAQRKVSREGGWATIGGKGGQRYLKVHVKLVENTSTPYLARPLDGPRIFTRM
jgi:hypothetical protein